MKVDLLSPDRVRISGRFEHNYSSRFGGYGEFSGEYKISSYETGDYTFVEFLPAADAKATGGNNGGADWNAAVKHIRLSYVGDRSPRGIIITLSDVVDAGIGTEFQTYPCDNIDAVVGFLNGLNSTKTP
jgi:hypothetical protein